MNLTKLLFRAARVSADGRAVRKGKVPQRVARKAVRRYVGGKSRGWF